MNNRGRAAGGAVGVPGSVPDGGSVGWTAAWQRQHDRWAAASRTVGSGAAGHTKSCAQALGQATSRTTKRIWWRNQFTALGQAWPEAVSSSIECKNWSVE